MLVRSVSNRWLRLLVATCLMLSVASAGVERAEVLETEVWPQERVSQLNTLSGKTRQYRTVHFVSF